MAEGIAKSASVAVPVDIVAPVTTHGIQMGDSENSLPVDIYRHFGLEWATPEKELNKVRDVYKWASENVEEFTLGNVMQKIRSLEMKLGIATNGLPLYDKLWNWVKMENSIGDMRKRQSAV